MGASPEQHKGKLGTRTKKAISLLSERYVDFYR